MNTHQLYYRCSKRPCPVEDLRWWLFLLPAINPVCTCAEGLEVVVFFVTGGGGFCYGLLILIVFYFATLYDLLDIELLLCMGSSPLFLSLIKKRYTTLLHIREKKKNFELSWNLKLLISKSSPLDRSFTSVRTRTNQNRSVCHWDIESRHSKKDIESKTGW